MPVRLKIAVNGQAAGTTYHGSDEAVLLANGSADTFLGLATDYEANGRVVVAASTTTGRYSTIYNMNSSSAQTLTVNPAGYWPVGTVLTIVQWGTAKTTVVAASGVTINLGNGVTTLVTGGQNYLGQLMKVASAPDVWVAFGGFGG